MKMFKIRNVKIHPIETCLLIGLVLSIICCFCSTIKESENLSNKILRLHIIPNSNSLTDQTLKIKLKNALLNKFNFDRFSSNIELAKKQVKQKLNSIENYSTEFLQKQGCYLPVKACVKKVNFKIRNYGEFSLPSGKYDALQIKIGKAKGKNWWCVFVPAMCVPAAKKTKNKLNKILNSNQRSLISKGSKNEIRFAIIDLYKKLKH